MKTPIFLAAALLCAHALAQPFTGPPGLEYTSAFADIPQGSEAPARDWKQANADVAQGNGHSGVMRGEPSQAAPDGAPRPAAPLLDVEAALQTARRLHPAPAGAAQRATDTRKAWISAVAAAQSARYLRDVQQAALAGAELARRMAGVGNWSRLEQAREQLLLADASVQLARAQQTLVSEREKLFRLMGDWPAGAHLPERLPELPHHTQVAPDLPVRSEVREAYLGYRSAYDVALYYRDEIIPLRKTIHDEVLLRYSGMLASVWELLAETRQQALGVSSAIEAQRDFWLAEADLQNALNGNPTP